MHTDAGSRSGEARRSPQGEAARGESDEFRGLGGRPGSNGASHPDPASWAIAVAAATESQVNAVMAQQLAAIDEALTSARENPFVFCSDVPDTGVGSRSNRSKGRGAEPEATGFAVMAAVADLATALHVSEGTIRVRAGHAATLIHRMPLLWQRFLSGETSYQHVRTILDVAVGLSAAAETWSAYDEGLADAATHVTAGVLRVKARKLRERLDTESLQVRHDRSRSERRIWVEADHDAMAYLGAYLPVDAAFRADARITGTARSLLSLPGETRTLAQVKADVLADLLTGDGTPYAVKTTLGLTLPMLTLLGHETDDPSALLEGMIPVDPATARRLVGNAPSFHRVLTDPVRGTILDVDRRSYRVPADLRRFIRVTRPVCAFPGCLRRAAETDTDHMADWNQHGVTADHNLQPVCRKHHRLKHCTTWRVHNPEMKGAEVKKPAVNNPAAHSPEADNRQVKRSTLGATPSRPPERSRDRIPVISRWTSPTGRVHDSDPPF